MQLQCCYELENNSIAGEATDHFMKLWTHVHSKDYQPIYEHRPLPAWTFLVLFRCCTNEIVMCHLKFYFIVSFLNFHLIFVFLFLYIFGPLIVGNRLFFYG